MKLTILGSGGCVPIPKPLCQCSVCTEARAKGRPYARAGSCAFLHELGLLIDTPPLIADAINYANLTQVDRLLYTHLDPDMMEWRSAYEENLALSRRPAAFLHGHWRS